MTNWFSRPEFHIAVVFIPCKRKKIFMSLGTFCSQKKQPRTGKSLRKIARVTRISRSSMIFTQLLSVSNNSFTASWRNVFMSKSFLIMHRMKVCIELHQILEQFLSEFYWFQVVLLDCKEVPRRRERCSMWPVGRKVTVNNTQVKVNLNLM